MAFGFRANSQHRYSFICVVVVVVVRTFVFAFRHSLPVCALFGQNVQLTSGRTEFEAHKPPATVCELLLLHFVNSIYVYFSMAAATTSEAVKQKFNLFFFVLCCRSVVLPLLLEACCTLCCCRFCSLRLGFFCHSKFFCKSLVAANS